MSDGLLHQHCQETESSLPGSPGHVGVRLTGRHWPQHDRPQLSPDDPPLSEEMLQHHRYQDLLQCLDKTYIFLTSDIYFFHSWLLNSRNPVGQVRTAGRNLLYFPVETRHRMHFVTK